MNLSKRDKAERITCWNYAATAVGRVLPPERQAALVEMTSKIPLDRLMESIKLALQNEPDGFRDVPSPGAVFAAHKAISRESEACRAQISAPKDMTPEQRQEFEDSNNPERWDSETLRLYLTRRNHDGAYVMRINRLIEQRHVWVEEELAKMFKGRNARAGVVLNERRRLLVDAGFMFPRPHPGEMLDRPGEPWNSPTAPEQFDLAESMKL